MIPQRTIVLSRFSDRGLTPEEFERVRGLASLHTPDKEIAHALGFSMRQWMDLRRQNPAISLMINRARAESAEQLRRAQWEQALRGSVPMQMWLGKALLHQNTKADQNDQPQTVAAQVADISPEARQSLIDLKNQIYAHSQASQQAAHHGQTIEVEACEVESETNQTSQTKEAKAQD